MISRALLTIVSLLHGLAFAQTARQGEATGTTPQGYRDFHTPMVLETVFLPADRSLWNKPDGFTNGIRGPGAVSKRDGWFTSGEYVLLRLSRCEKVAIGALEMKAREFPKDKADIAVKVSLFNPDQGHDKKVILHFEVMNGDEIVGSFDLPVSKVKEGAMVTKTINTTLPLEALKTDPMTKLRITMQNWDY
jgi:hypothetical protein